MIELNEEQKLAVEKAQNEFSQLKNNSDNLTDDQLNLLFGQARSMNGWKDQDVSDDMLYSLYELTKMGPTSTNSCPGRFVFIKSQKTLIL